MSIAPVPESEPLRYCFTVPRLPPSLNHYLVRVHGGRSVLSPAAKTFLQEVFFASHNSRIPKQRRENYGLEVWLWMLDDASQLDGDNGWKCVADSLVKCRLIHNDREVRDWTLRKRYVEAAPRVRVEIIITSWGAWVS